MGTSKNEVSVTESDVGIIGTTVIMVGIVALLIGAGLVPGELWSSSTLNSVCTLGAL